jgi:hypothetical protein
MIHFGVSLFDVNVLTASKGIDVEGDNEQTNQEKRLDGGQPTHNLTGAST